MTILKPYMAHMVKVNEIWLKINCTTWLWAENEAYNFRKPSRYIEFWELSVCEFCELT